MLQLAGGITLSVNVRNFLQLQGAFKRNRIVDITPYINEILVLVELLCKEAALSVGGKGAFHLCRQLRQLANGRLHVSPAITSYASNVSGKQKQRCELGGEALGGGNGSFLARMGENGTGGVLRQRR